MENEHFTEWTRTPPMGWNSWDCFGGAVIEQEVLANADYMAEYLAQFGWQYIVVDIAWYNPEMKGYEYPQTTLTMDEWGRLLPALNRFPSAANGAGFKTLGDYIHKKGLKFGIHMMRGIPRQAVVQNCPILNSKNTAAEIADQKSTCPWNPDMYGIDMIKPGAQEYLNSLLTLWADWGVDYIKIDDCHNAYKGIYHRGEIEGYRKAIDQCGRKIVLSLSPGPMPRKEIQHLRANANLFRISMDVWDKWWQLRLHFKICARWAPLIQEGYWPDADMLPFGHIRVHKPVPGFMHGEGRSNFSHDELRTFMTLLVMFKSPLMFGGHMPDNDEFVLSLITNTEVLQVHRESIKNRVLYDRLFSAGWVADDRKSGDKFVALFNFRKKKSAEMSIQAKKIELTQAFRVRDLWNQQDLGVFENTFFWIVPPHGVGFFRVTPLTGKK
jgi:hypothetical protein